MKLTWAALLALAGTAVSHAHHGHDDEVIPERVREELLAKWNQEVGNSFVLV
jgi:agmatinase